MNSTEKAEIQEEEELIPDEAPEDADDDEDDVRLSDSRNEEEDERREARRNERKRRRENQRFARDKSKEELNFLMEQNRALQQRLAVVENHAIATHKGSLDQSYNQALHTVKQAEEALAKAIEIGNGAQVPQLLRARDQAMARAAEINRMKSRAVAPPQQDQQRTAPPDPEVRERAEEWAERNRWFNPNGDDPDSLAAKKIDAGLVAEGYDPASKRYWKELDRRLSQRLPHRFADDDDSGYSSGQRSGRRGPPVSGSREISSPSSRKVYLSPERVQAMKDAGYWDDPVLRQRMLKRYQETDRENYSAR